MDVLERIAAGGSLGNPNPTPVAIAFVLRRLVRVVLWLVDERQSRPAEGD